MRSLGVTESGKIEIVFDEAKRPLPFRHPELSEVKRLGGKIVTTEVLTDRDFKGWETGRSGDVETTSLAVLAIDTMKSQPKP
jgi:hypothetical protein